MKKRLFVSELKRAFLPTFVSLFSVYFIALVVERVLVRSQGQTLVHSDSQNAVSLFLGAWMVASGFLSGVRPFSTDFKTSHSLLLQTLPLRRTWVWLLLVTASLLMSLVCLSALLLFRPGMLFDSWTVYLCLAVYLTLFAAGCCFVFLHDRLYLVYIVGMITAAIVIGIILVYADYYYRFRITDSLNWMRSVSEMDPGGLHTGVRFIAISLLLVSALFLSLSCFFYTSGEFALLRTRLRNHLSLFVATSIFLLCLSYVTPFIVKGTEKWQVTHEIVSSDGKYVAVEEAQHVSPFHKMTVIEMPTGKVMGRIEFLYGTFIGWSRTEDFLTIIASKSPLLALLHPQSVTIEQLSPDCHLIWARMLDGMLHGIAPLPQGDWLAVVRSANMARIRILSINSKSGELKEILMPGNGLANLRVVDPGVIIRFWNDQTSKAWLYQGGLKDLRYVAARLDTGGNYLIDDTLYDLSPFKKELARVYPAPVPGPGSYYFRSFLTTVPPLFYVHSDESKRTAELYLATGPNTPWRQLAAGIPLQAHDATELRQSDLWDVELNAIEVNYRDHVAVFVSANSGNRMINVYDMSRDSILSAETLALPVVPIVHIKRIQGAKAVCVLIGHLVGEDQEVTDQVFVYDPEKRRLKETKLGEDHVSELLYWTEKGDSIFTVQSTDNVVRIDSSGRRLQLWPQQ